MSFSLFDTTRTITTLGNLVERKQADIQTGPFGTMLKASSYTLEGTPVIAVKDIGVNRIIHGQSPKVDISDAKRLSKYMLKTGDIVFGRKGAVERRALITEKEDGWLQGSDCIRLRFNTPDIDPEYVSYFFGTKFYTNWILSNAQGTTMPSLNQEILKRVPLPLPPVEEQKKIASVLKGLDDKIECNNAINRNLEELAKSLFIHWFIDFEFPNENGGPYKSSGGEFEESELGIKPKGWSVGTIEDLANNRKKTIKASEIPKGTAYVGLEHLPRKKLFIGKLGVSEGIESNKTLFQKNDILFGKLRPYFHKVAIAPTSGVCSTDIIAIYPIDPKHYGYLTLQLFSEKMIEFVTNYSNGTRMPRTNWNDISRYPVLIPNDQTSALFTEIIHRLVDFTNCKLFESIKLIETRDSLLPKLMSGEIRVPIKED
ncbi:hypothetical protein CBW65_12130 [Tumebacillus avium]|uniref:Type I restriction modification DNA specificity domain-containing protein n=1 Tax=Tumebacillus avium TaxID=1903704 RepID=A0A1Y0IQQ9_9BACL|nr:restriction endonuclease subunit S [Tumebacillus avium]ARU61684.1 hypothetical protein CBW65_12130 [Tumebacillus avium]